MITECQAIPAEIMADLVEVCRQAATGRVADLELVNRVHERAERVREEIYKEHGLLNVAVDLIRETRNDE